MFLNSFLLHICHCHMTKKSFNLQSDPVSPGQERLVEYEDAKQFRHKHLSQQYYKAIYSAICHYDSDACGGFNKHVLIDVLLMLVV